MKKWIITLILSSAPLFAFAAGGSDHHAAKHINTQQLQQLIEGKPTLVIDARSQSYYDGKLIPGATWMPHDTPEAKLIAAIPSKDFPIVVYCAGPGCPASSKLAARLTQLGYTNVYEYTDGITGWAKQGNSTENRR
jgi:rhodanese-related sulfurtransferase